MSGDHEAAFRALAEDPERWLSSGRNLLASADLLWATVADDFQSKEPADSNHADVAKDHRPDRGRPFMRDAAPYLMLAGFAVENALKALRLVQGMPVTHQGAPRLSGEVQMHKLLKLASDARLELSSSEQELLGRLEVYLTWAGRYPVATTANRQAVVQNIWRSDATAVKAFFDRVETSCRR